MRIRGKETSYEFYLQLVSERLPPPAANASSNAAATQSAIAANVATDTVQLTEAQQVYQLFNQGQSVSQISSSLGLSVASVKG
jgi:DNA-binding NarL/FixJ family response regulator